MCYTHVQYMYMYILNTRTMILNKYKLKYNLQYYELTSFLFTSEKNFNSLDSSFDLCICRGVYQPNIMINPRRLGLQ